jgi:pilus assembly protein CpaC
MGFASTRQPIARRLLVCSFACACIFAAGLVLLAPMRDAVANGPMESAPLSLNDPGRVGHMRLTINKSQTLRFTRTFTEALVASPDIADVVPLTDQSIYVVAKKIGLTRLTLLDRDKRLMGIVEIEVTFDLKGLREELMRSVPTAHLRISTANGRIILGGVVPDAIALAKIIAITEQFTAGCEESSEGPAKSPSSAGATQPTSVQLQISTQPSQKSGPGPKCFVNSLRVRAPQQVLLEVRFVEAQRSAARDLGFKWSASGARFTMQTGIGGFPSANVPFGQFLARVLDAGTKVDVLIEALEKRGVVRRLAEPNLTALSGDTANFLAGGEFPFPVAADRDRITIEFKKFGIGLAFTPTVLAEGQINLKIEPEVSDLDPNNTILVANTQIPSLVVRRANTTVELRDGQSFAIAGLFMANHTKNTREMPWITQVPVLSTLFRSASYEKEESDLVIIVTPRLVKPAVPGQKLLTPLDQKVASNDRDYFVRGKLEVPTDYEGPYGHTLSFFESWEPTVLQENGNGSVK